jgi:hypothetical protein
MKKFRIVGKYVTVVTQEVEAENKESAEDKFGCDFDSMRHEELEMEIDSVEEINENKY